MPRELSERDIEILKKLAPECEGLTCSGSGHQFHSILPPVSNHFSVDERDFAERIGRLTDDELKYISGLILSGEESLGCLPEEDIDSLLTLITERFSREEGKKVIEAFASFGVCEERLQDASLAMIDMSKFLRDLTDHRASVRATAAKVLGTAGSAEALPALISSLKDDKVIVRCEAALALGKLGDAGAVPALVAMLRDTEKDARLAAMVALGKIRDRSAVSPLIACLQDKDMQIRVGAIETLASVGDPRALEPVRTLLQDRFSDVRETAQLAIRKLGKK